jgi:flagellar hook protein FlgE
MSRSLFSAVSGLRTHQEWLDVIGNNIANANTPGFKASSAVFQDILSQTLSAGSAPATNLGGINPMQIGLGVTLGSVTPSFLQGSIQTTNRSTDMAIQGDGFFIVANGNSRLYTRAGAFTLDANGDLVEGSTGYKVQGASGNIRVNLGQQSAATPTSEVALKGNLDYSVPDGTTYAVTIPVVDSVGASHTLAVTFTKNFAATAGQWDWAVTGSDASILAISSGSGVDATWGTADDDPATGSLTFGADGAITAGDFGVIDVVYTAASGVSSPQELTLDFGTAASSTPMTGLAATSSATLGSQDGLPTGTLQSFAVGSDGTITGYYSNGTNENLGVVQLAIFNNPSGLLQAGANHFQESAASGVASTGDAGVGGRGTLTPGSLEASNVDLGKEFTAMILAQTGFQANARTIQASDELLKELVNLRR